MVLIADNEVPSRKRKGYWDRAMENAWFSSAVEVIFALVVSNLAIAISIFVYLLLQESNDDIWKVIVSTFVTNIKPSEIFVYILGFTAPAMWIVVNNFRLWRHLYFLLLILLIQAVVVLSTAIIFALSLAQTLKNVNLATQWTWGCLLCALIVWYGTLVYQKAVLGGLGEQVNKPKPGRESGSEVLAMLKGEE